MDVRHRNAGRRLLAAAGTVSVAVCCAGYLELGVSGAALRLAALWSIVLGGTAVAVRAPAARTQLCDYLDGQAPGSVPSDDPH